MGGSNNTLVAIETVLYCGDCLSNCHHPPKEFSFHVYISQALCTILSGTGYG